MNQRKDTFEMIAHREEQIRKEEREKIIEKIRTYRPLTIEGLGRLVWTETLIKEVFDE